VALLLAAEEQCEALAKLLARYPAELEGCRAEIIHAVPETCRPRRYAPLLPADPAQRAALVARRVERIEGRTGLVDTALELVEAAGSALPGGLRGAAARDCGLRALRDELASLATLVYECGAPLGLAAFRAANLGERLRAATAGSTRETFVRDLRERAGPMLEAAGAEAAHAALAGLLEGLAAARLDWVGPPPARASCGAGRKRL